jgi:hypothetical protein
MHGDVGEIVGRRDSAGESYRILPWVGFLAIVALAALGGVLLSGVVDRLI